jgi:WD40 repeat protein
VNGYQQAHNGLINSVAFSPDGAWLASGGWDGVARFWRVADGNPGLAHTIGFGCGIIRVEFAPVHGQVLAVGSQFLGIRLWNLKRPRESPREIQTPTTALLFSPDGASLFSGGNDGLIKIWDPVTLDQRSTLKGHKTTVVGLAMSHDSKTLISCSWDKTVRFWHAANEELVAADQWEN